MLDAFLGESQQKVDQKGRASVPHFFRRVIERGDEEWSEGKRPGLVIVYGPKSWRRLDCYTVASHARMIRRIAKMKRGTEDRRNMEQIYSRYVVPAQLDEEGRLTIPLKCREKLELKDSVYMAAAGDHFEIWKTDVYEAEEPGGVDEWLASKGPDFDPDILLPELDDEE